MTELVCNFWLEPAVYRCIPTTGVVTSDGLAVLDCPLSKEAAQRYTGLEADLGWAIASRGNRVQIIRPGLVSFPIKQFQWSGPALPVIERSAHELCELVGNAKTLLPRPGCGPGQLSWEDVSRVLSFLENNIYLVRPS